VRDIGYFASELRGSVPLSDEGDSGPLAVETNFYEFFPVDEDRDPAPHELLTLDKLKEGARYFVYVTTLGGLYRYNMNDILEVTGSYEKTPLIHFVQKSKGAVSLTGEKLFEEQVISAVEKALESQKGKYDFVQAVGEMAEGLARYVFLVEFQEQPSDDEARQLVGHIDQCLGEINSEYRSKRDSKRIGPPVLRLVKRGSLEEYRKKSSDKGGQDGQFKTVKLTDDPKLAKELKTEKEFVMG
jgi:hypothetical protein